MHIPRKLTTAVFSAVVAASLGFGATQAFSQASAKRFTCPYKPPLLAGSTATDQICANRCASFGQPYHAWDPETTCCACPD